MVTAVYAECHLCLVSQKADYTECCYAECRCTECVAPRIIPLSVFLFFVAHFVFLCICFSLCVPLNTSACVSLSLSVSHFTISHYMYPSLLIFFSIPPPLSLSLLFSIYPSLLVFFVTFRVYLTLCL